MAVDLLNNNTTRHFTVPDATDLTFPNSDWFLALWTNVNNNDGTLFQYMFSNNGVSTVNSLNILLLEDSAGVDSDKWRVITDNFDEAIPTTTGADDINRLIVTQRNGSNIEVWFAEPGQTATLEIDSAYSDGAINGGNWFYGCRSDTDTARFYENPLGPLVKGSVALTQAQIELLANGVIPTLVTAPANLDIWFPFTENAATITDLANGHIATRQGTGLVTVEHFPVVSGTTAFIGDATNVNTRAKRLSMLNFRSRGRLLPDPNTSGVDQGERQTFLNKYSGVLFAGAPAGGRIMGSLAGKGGLAGVGGIAGQGGGMV